MKLRILSSILLIIVSLLFILDKLVEFFNLEIKNTYGFNSPENFAFIIGIQVGILLLIIATKLKPFYLFYSFPVYSNLLYFYNLFFTTEHENKRFFNFYILTTTFLFVILLRFISEKTNKYLHQQTIKNEEIKLLVDIWDLSILKKK